MKEGVAGCDIVVLMISGAFCKSGTCMFESIMATSLKTASTSSRCWCLTVGGRGPWGDEDRAIGMDGGICEYWRRHAQDICDPERPDLNEGAGCL